MKSIVVPARRSSFSRSMHCSWKAASPTASTSSTSRMSGSRCAATAKPSRTYIPEEYHFTGMSMNSRDAGELDDPVELRLNLPSPHTEHRSAQIDVLATGELGMKAGAHLDERRDTAGEADLAGGRRGDARQQLEDGALARAVVADQAECFAAADFECDVLDGPEILDAARTQPPHQPDALADAIALRDAMENNGEHG